MENGRRHCSIGTDPAAPGIGPCRAPLARSSAYNHMPDTPGHWAISWPPAAAGILLVAEGLDHLRDRADPQQHLAARARHHRNPPPPKVPKYLTKKLSLQHYHCLWLIKAAYDNADWSCPVD